ncbi:hypothetical protein Golomagni_04045 [Golovinomyces magnicellulatus]|nr:hypothetical protein Golomagni_04045 [Golovinomyces magnicellulatus]
MNSSSRPPVSANPLNTLDSSKNISSTTISPRFHSIPAPENIDLYPQGVHGINARDEIASSEEIIPPLTLDQVLESSKKSVHISKTQEVPHLSIETNFCETSSESTKDKHKKDSQDSSFPISRDFAVDSSRDENFWMTPNGTNNGNLNSAHSHGFTKSPFSEINPFYSLRNRKSDSPRSFLSTVFSEGVKSPVELYQTNIDTGVADILRQRQIEFFKWIDDEMEKVETFYKSKEDEAEALLSTLRDQLHEMRNRRIEELAAAHQLKYLEKKDREPLETAVQPKVQPKKLKKNGPPTSQDQSIKTTNSAWKKFVTLRDRFTGAHVGANSKALQDMHTSPVLKPRNFSNESGKLEEIRDSVQRFNYNDNVSYRTAKRKLKLALLECYRGMEMLKSYALLNRMAFKKISKKYHRTIGTNNPIRYLSEKVDKSWFVQSDVLDAHIHAAVDLYARYFERGHHKVAFVKLRDSFARRTDKSGNAFRNGVLIGVGAVFSIEGLTRAVELLRHQDLVIRIQTSYILQLYAGYFLALYLFAFFCLDCCIWTRNRINYQFVFEFGPKRILDWREMANIPSFLIATLGLCVWVNFSMFGASQMYIYFPLILILFTVIVIFLPAPILFHRGRIWFLYSNWRLLLAGLYPVEFRDFFLGDMYCSLTYVMANIEVFFCLYLNHWNDPPQCGSTHSVLLGFFTALPSVWRALQCLRRYYDTGDKFPHLVNCAKYMTTIIYYTALSVYRINETKKNVIFFLIAAGVNSVSVSLWDVLMDWSLLQPNAKNRFLRNVRGYRKTWWYYAAMILNPALRLDWLLYTVNIHVLGHSTQVTFYLALTEVTRRGIWAIFRVENEHCSNVARFKASRDPELPYATAIEPKEKATEVEDPNKGQLNLVITSPTLEAQNSAGSNNGRRPLTKILADAHTQDFQKRRRHASNANLLGTGNNHSPNGDSSDDGEEDEPDQQVVLDVAAFLREKRRLARETSEEESSPTAARPGL